MLPIPLDLGRASGWDWTGSSSGAADEECNVTLVRCCIHARKVTEQLIADLWNGRDAASLACVPRPREADPEARHCGVDNLVGHTRL
jgi:hypothetical protein